MLYVLTCYMDYVRELTAVYWDRRFDAFDPELVAPFRALKGMTQKKVSRKDANSS